MLCHFIIRHQYEACGFHQDLLYRHHMSIMSIHTADLGFHKNGLRKEVGKLDP